MKKIVTEALISLLIFCASFFAVSRVDWLNVFGWHPYIVSEKFAEWAWKITELSIVQVNDKETTGRAEELIDKMCSANDIDASQINIIVVREDEVNACATVGNRILINSGLLKEVENDAQLCAVLGHELAHLQLGHLKQGLRERFSIGLIIAFVTGNNNAGELANTLVQNLLTRDKETEADEQGAAYMEKMGLDPLEMANFLETLPSSGYLQYMMDHPDSKERAEHIREIYESKSDK